MVALVRGGAGCAGALLHPPHRYAHQRVAPLDRLRPNHLSTIGTCKNRNDFLAAWFARGEKPDGNVFSGFIIPLVIIGLPAALVLGEVDLGTTALIAATT